VKKLFTVLAPVLFFLPVTSTRAEIFRLPTANHALFEKGGEEKFFIGTTGKPWTSGTFGCVRSDGGQMHEGLDIKCLERDSHGEPADPVMATAEGTVAYFSKNSALSNYGKYIVLRHRIDGLEIYSLYAHLSEIRGDLKIGKPVQAGEKIATMGRTSNTRERISKERAHVHFELNLFYNDRFSAWHKKTSPTQRNDHGDWNGQNIVGLDARLILLAQREQGAKFNLLHWIQNRTELCRVLVSKTGFSWLHRYSALIEKNPLAEKKGIAGYEIALDYNGLPFRLIPRAASEIKGSAKYQVLSVNEPEYTKNPCRRLVTRHGAHWQLSSKGINLLDLLTY